MEESLSEENRKNCYTEKCSELVYNEIEMGFEGVTGKYPQSMSYGTQGYFIDFEGANKAEFHKRVQHLKDIKWID